MRQEDDHREEANAVENLLGARRFHAEDMQQIGQALGEPSEQKRSQNRPEERADAADDRCQDQLDRTRDMENLLGEQVVVIKSEEYAGGGGQARRQSDRDHLVAKRVDAERTRRLLIL